MCLNNASLICQFEKEHFSWSVLLKSVIPWELLRLCREWKRWMSLLTCSANIHLGQWCAPWSTRAAFTLLKENPAPCTCLQTVWPCSEKCCKNSGTLGPFKSIWQEQEMGGLSERWTPHVFTLLGQWSPRSSMFSSKLTLNLKTSYGRTLSTKMLLLPLSPSSSFPFSLPFSSSFSPTPLVMEQSQDLAHAKQIL